ncbi:fibronectin type III domain-containing protein [Streptomyces sp. G-G2]|uniref:fibronectin type III domain-containing protein n=1 Tax=Streptomyces sp. G-G2 TaxID=3046201 RepID=UPI0024BAC3FE|nr:fibronectin type III domain-containing protein [Streptomyces sp. G-G2]MDJ0383633.1 fibronectin type III domain-containing protein [Streptomyces sp. G-G2]
MRRPTAFAAASCCLAAALLTGCAAPDTRPPASPTGLTAQAGSATAVHVMWEQADPRDGVSGYQILRGDALVREVPANKTMVDLTGLAPLTAYAFTVRAKDSAGNLSAPSTAATVTTPAAEPADHGPPTAPAGATGHPDGPRAAVLSWSPATDDTGVTAYDVYQGGVRIHTAPGTATTTRLTGLQPDTVYTFTVRARDGADTSSPDSAGVDVTTATATGRGPGTAPADFGAAVAPGTVTLSWNPPDTGEQTREYQLYVNEQPTTIIQFGAGAVPTGRARYQLAVTEPKGTAWALKLRARLPDGNWGSFSAERRVTLG